MSESFDLAQHISAIVAAARTSDDGERCTVAPHPDLREKLQKEFTKLRDSSALFGAHVLRAGEPTAVGLNDGVLIPPEDFPLDTPMSIIRNAAADRAPLRGVLRVIVVLVDFSDKAMAQTPAHYQNLFFSTGVIPTKSVREYYKDVTHGLIDIQGQVVGPFRLPKTLAQYAHGASGLGSALPNAATMARDAAQAANPTVNFAPFDNDGNGFVDAFIVIHAGAGAEVTGNSGDIWSHKWTLDGGALSMDGTKIFAYLTVPEDAKIGVCCHELGHLLFGFPDLYDTDGSSEGIGNFCLMAAGSWGGGGDTPVHPSAWCKANQGWATVINQTTNGALSIADVKTSQQIYRLWKNGATGNEYFLLENRQKAGFDASLPGPGLLIWHIDESVTGNTNETHYKVALMQADGKKDLEHNVNRGDAGDPYPGSAHNASFSAGTTPNSNSYANVATCVSVTAISASAATMSANVAVTCKTKELKDIKEIKEIVKENSKDFKDLTKDTKEVAKEHKDLIKETKEFAKDNKDAHKDTKEVSKEHKDLIKDTKELAKDLKDGIKEHLGEKGQGKEVEKPTTDKAGGFDKGTDGGKLTEGNLGGGGLLHGTAALEARIANLESLLSQAMGGGSGGGSQAQAFIGEELRPDLSQGALSHECDCGRVKKQMMHAAARSRRMKGQPG